MGLEGGIGKGAAPPQGGRHRIAPASRVAARPGGALVPALALLWGRIDGAALHEAQRRAVRHGTCPLHELTVGLAPERVVYRALAEALALPFACDTGAIALRRCDRAVPAGARVLLAREGDRARWLVSPDAADAEALASGSDVPATVVPPSVMAALVERGRAARAMDRAVHWLHRERPDGSARTVMTAPQGFVLASAVAMLLALFALHPAAALLGVHAVATLGFLCCIALRVLAARGASPPRYPPLKRVRERDLPVYTVLAVLYREAPVVPQLIEHLARLHWPRGKLDVRLVCEGDDEETLRAIEAHGLPPHMRVVAVPPGRPRTKPKALNYAMDGARGAFVVVYDAEDRPHPFQLREAWQRFRDGPPSLGCLQAALQIDNGERSFLSRGFAVEYAALFRGLLPWLAKRNLPLPLGGTSNHFRVEALDAVGGWDPFNVTEDADLGFRLHRGGWRIGTLTRPTLEAAPEAWREWRDQRARWLKGWAQTWLVHMRSPVRLWREAGVGGFVMLQVAMLGILGSALLHPFMFVTLAAVALAAVADILPAGFGALLLAIDTVNIALGYAAMYALTRAVLRPRERWLLRGSWWRLPLYWLHLVPPAWRGVIELARNPHRWSKTPHRPVRASSEAARAEPLTDGER